MKKLILIFLTFFSFSFGKTSEEPVLIEAKELIYKKQENIAVYTGNVVVKKGDLTINADKMTIYLDEKGDVFRILAEGNVKFQKGNRSGRSNMAEYIKSENIIILKENAKLMQDKNIIEGDKIIYHLDTEMAEVTGKDKRVRTIIFPDNLPKKE